MEKSEILQMALATIESKDKRIEKLQKEIEELKERVKELKGEKDYTKLMDRIKLLRGHGVL